MDKENETRPSFTRVVLQQQNKNNILADQAVVAEDEIVVEDVPSILRHRGLGRPGSRGKTAAVVEAPIRGRGPRRSTVRGSRDLRRRCRGYAGY